MDFDVRIRDTKFEAVKDKINPTLLANPAFTKVFQEACINAHGMTGSNEYQICVSEDGKLVSVTVEVEDKEKNNRILIVNNISLDGDAISVEFCKGALEELNDYDKKKYGEIQYKCILSTYYSNDIYDEKGIQLQRSWYGDRYPLNNNLNNIDLKRQILLNHKPKFKLHDMPGNPNYYHNAFSGCILRYYDNLGCIYRTYVDNNTAKITHGIYAVSTEFPERIVFDQSCPVALRNENDEFVVNSNLYGDKTLEDVCEQIKANFRAGLETSKTKEYDPEMYKNLVETTEKTLTR